MQFDTVYYHKNCSDGTASAFCLKKYADDNNFLDNVKFIPVTFGDKTDIQDVENKNIVMVDFVFPKDDLLVMSKIATTILILDHHKSAERMLQDPDFEAQFPNVKKVFSMKRSGCQIAWDYYFPVQSRPWFIDVIADRDLWKWEIPESKELNKALFVQNLITFEGMRTLLNDENPTITKNLLAIKGKSLLQFEEENIQRVVKCSLDCIAKTPNGNKYKVKLVCCPDHTLTSEVGNRLAKMDDVDFSCMWRYDFEKDQYWISARSSDESNLDLSIVAKQFDPDGGGHFHASGFSIHGNKGENLKTYFSLV